MKDTSPTSTPAPKPEGADVELVSNRWFGMASAPKDGTRILVHDGETCYVVAWLNGSTARRGRMMEWAIPESWQDEQGGYSTCDNPLGWMPLPSLPNAGHQPRA